MRLLGGILLVAGTTIGAGMLALPVATAAAGLWPALLLFGVVWFFMIHSAFLMLEVNFAVGVHGNVITMARRTLGPVGAGVAWVSYLLLLYALMAAYISGSGALLAESVGSVLPLKPSLSGLPFVLLFGGLVYGGVRSVDRLNRILMVGLGACFIALIGAVLPHADSGYLLHAAPKAVLAPLSVVVTSFGFHIILPSLASYLEGSLSKMRLCLWIGGVIPVVIYLLWEVAILGIIPLTGDQGLSAMLEGGQPAASLTHALAAATGWPFLKPVMTLFSFSAILTSFLGVSLSLSDFLFDGLRIAKSKGGRILVTLLTFAPSLFFALCYPRGFITALSYGGVFVAVLLGLLPTAMAWSVRYHKRVTSPYRAFGGRPLLLLAMAFFLLVIFQHFHR